MCLTSSAHTSAKNSRRMKVSLTACLYFYVYASYLCTVLCNPEAQKLCSPLLFSLWTLDHFWPENVLNWLTAFHILLHLTCNFAFMQKRFLFTGTWNSSIHFKRDISLTSILLAAIKGQPLMVSPKFHIFPMEPSGLT